MNQEAEAEATRVLILTPTGRDAAMICARLVEERMHCEVCPDLPALLEGLAKGAGAAVIAQEALSVTGAAGLMAALEAQEPWSDVPVLLLSEARSKRRPRIPPAFFEHANVTLLQRPLGLHLFSSSVRAAVRARRRQYQMRDLYQQLERAVQLSDTFVGILGHDLRTPLGAITLSAQTIVRFANDDRALRPSQRILTSSERMARMIEQLLDFARVRRGTGIPLKPRPVHLGELCRQLIQELEAAKPQASLQLREVGDLCGGWDPDRLAQVVSNLIDNAVQYGTKGKPVTLELDGTDAPSVRLCVRNFGSVPPEQLPVIFEAFKRATTPSKAAGPAGLGLGLFIAREIVRAHGGEILVQSVQDLTDFEVILPRDARPTEAAAPTTA